MKKFSDLTEREVLTVAIASEEDGRIYMSSQRTSDSYHNCASRRFSERYAMIRIATWFTWLLVFGWACAAHASPVPPADPVWSTDRIAQLPREVRERVLSACGPQARAGHYFATYGPHSDAIHLDYSASGMPRPVELRRRDQRAPPDLRQTRRRIRLVSQSKGCSTHGRRHRLFSLTA